MKPWLALLALMILSGGVQADDYFTSIEQWRARRLERLRQPNGWLTLVGLFWMEKGENRLGSAADCSFRLTAGPAYLGSYHWDGIRLGWKSEATGEKICDPDEPEAATILQSGSISWYTIRRDGRLGLRVKDNDSPVRRAFKGLDFFTIDPAWRVQAHFKPYDRPREMRAESVISGLEEVSQSPGEIEFSHQGKSYSLQVSQEGEGYSLMFGDRSNGHGSYGGGRFLDIEKADARGGVVLDFNKAYNPPCCWTPYATCPLPTPQNRLDFEIPAGEQFGGH
ncbi:MAG: DUF1684 domain-containing protein [Candidatus Eremiobacteraeota bacterium]|nr:DUF1684 domain-containing protein [Candidatus Eremiobacteraeota bacterium]MCW5871903.1 DUF1684 domain-containing protein [Candidatus Eremiobacteraeota bacterium]